MSVGPRQLYETLARYQWWRRRWAGAGAGDGLEIRKRLRPAETAPADSGAALDRWAFELAAVPPRARVLDLGCGFGASLLRWIEWSAGCGVGVTASRYQVRRAREEAVRRGLGERAEFREQDFALPVPGRFDAAFAIEALGHAADLAAVYDNLHAALKPGARFVQIEDLLHDGVGRDADVAEIARRWASPPLRHRDEVRAALRAARFVVRDEIELTARVAPAAVAEIDRREARLRRWRVLPSGSWRRLVDAFLGGCALERLYATHRACYVVFLCDRE